MENTDNDHLKVFVSRLPSKWSKDHLKEHFEACFGKVIDSHIRLDQQYEKSMGYGFVTFETKESKLNAVAQGSMHVGHRTVQIRDVSRSAKEGEGEESAVGDAGMCFAWQKFSCVKGNACKFKHEGPGKCIVASAFGEGKTKKCISFKKTGKCSKGDGCPFQHIRNKIESSKPDVKTAAVPAGVDGKKGLCHSFTKKGKCRKGDACMFSHDVPAAKAKSVSSVTEGDSASGKRKINGNVLVQKRRRMLAEAEAGDTGDAGISITGDE